jgi:hypothetical protein
MSIFGQSTDLLESALALASRGLKVFPCRARTKFPATDHGFKDASDDADQIKKWWGINPQYNIAIATGKVSGIFVVDIDGPTAEAELNRLEAEHGKLPVTVEVITGRGRHLYFTMPNDPAGCSVGKIGKGIDVRANGGYVMVPPSIHESGRRYGWSRTGAKDFAHPPDWLSAKIVDPVVNGRIAPTPPGEFRILFSQGVDEGQRDASAARLTGYLLRHRIDPYAVLEIVRLWNAARCRPPLPELDIDRIVNSIAGKELKRRTGK